MQYTASTTTRTALPRSKRMRNLGATTITPNTMNGEGNGEKYWKGETNPDTEETEVCTSLPVKINKRLRITDDSGTVLSEISIDENGRFFFSKGIVSLEDVVSYGMPNAEIATVSEMIEEYVTAHQSQFGSLSQVSISESSGTGNAITELTANLTQNGKVLTIIPTKGEKFALKSEIPASLPASDVYSWAKASTKPSYSYSEITGTPASLPANGGRASALKDIYNYDQWIYANYWGTDATSSQIKAATVWSLNSQGEAEINSCTKSTFQSWLGLGTNAYSSDSYLGVNDNAESATRLNTVRTLWGQSFDGTGNVSGDIIGAASGINLEYDNEINCYHNNLYLNHRGTRAGYNNQYTSNIIALANGGNFGIGITNPSEKLEVNGNIALGAGTDDRHVILRTDGDLKLCATNSAGWAMGTTYYKHDQSTFIGYGAGAYGNGDTLNYYFFGGQYNTPSAVIMPDGKVGIGTTSPSEKLEVNGNGKFNGFIGFYGIDGATRVGYIGRASTALNNIYVNTDSTANYVCLQSGGGNVGIGTITPTNKLDVYGVIQSHAYNAIGNNNASFVFDKPSSHYTGIGANTEADTIYFGACGVTGAWVSGYFQKWKFGGQIKVQSTDYECVRMKRCIANGGAFTAYYANNQDDESYFCGMNSSKKFTIGRAVISQGVDVALVKIDNAGNIVANGDVTAYSDARLKSDIKDLEYRGPLNPKTYIKDGKKSIGFIAQEVREKYPELVQGEETEDSYLSLNYGAITAVLAAENKELKDEVTELKSEVAELKELVKQLIGGK